MGEAVIDRSELCWKRNENAFAFLRFGFKLGLVLAQHSIEIIKRGLALLDDRHVDEEPQSGADPEEFAPPVESDRFEPTPAEGTHAQL